MHRPFGSFWRFPTPPERQRIWVLGASGQLGQVFCQEWPGYGTIRGFSREQWDITRPDHLENYLYKIEPEERPHVIINCAAYTNVDHCQKFPDRALAVNAHGVGLIAHACERFSIFLVHISSDYIFSGEKQRPYLETDPPDPVNVYGQSKLEGEKEVSRQMVSGRFLIVRTSWVFSGHGRNFVTWCMEQFDRGHTIRCVKDQVGAATYAPDLVQTVYALLEMGYGGWFHFRNEPPMTRCQQVLTIAQILAIKEPRIVAVRRDELNWVAPRPAYSVLDIQRIKETLNQEPRSWVNGLKAMLARSDV